MDRYDPKKFLSVEKITMMELEKLYSTVLIKNDCDYVIQLFAPLPVCLALHGRCDDICYLLKKYPLVSADGWTKYLKSIDLEEVFMCLTSISGRINTTFTESANSTLFLTTGFVLPFSNISYNECKKFFDRTNVFKKYNLIYYTSDMKKVIGEKYRELRKLMGS